jgi:curved DNA-binding protein CbpA
MSGHRCSRCGAERPPELVCASCGAIQPLRDEPSYFFAMGLPEHPAVDPRALESRYYELSRQLHPDRHQTGDPDQLARSVRASALVNQAYRTLRDVESRGRYWLRRLGDDLGRDNSRVPAALAAFVFDVQEKLAELRAGRGSGNGNGDGREDLRRDLGRVHDEIESRIEAERDALRDLLDGWPEGASVKGARDLPARTQQLKDRLSELSYLKTLDREVRSGLAG